MREICEYDKCTGCHACMSVCPKQCIHMEENKEGFLYPVIDESKCVDCGLCKKTCMVSKKSESTFSKKAYAMMNLDEEERKKSSSGGVFSLLAKNILANNGVVYGVAFNDKYEVEHIRIDAISDLDKLRTSKYVQSKIGNCYVQAKQDLDKGIKVLFTGTPCQIAGLRGYLKKDYDNLYCQDIMCHGAPTPKLWRKYLEEIKSGNKGIKSGNKGIGNIEEISFRDKSVNWWQFSMKIKGANGEIKDIFFDNTYMKAFLADIALRKSCTNCNCKELNYFSDITLADFWGLNKSYPELDDSTGVSLVLASTEKGELLIKQIASGTKITEVDVEKAVSGNKPAITNTPAHKNRDKFFEHIDDMTVQQLVKKYVEGNLIQKVLRKIVAK